MSGLTQEQLEQLCAEWQKILRLQDWDIEVSIVPQRAFDSLTKQGDVSINQEHRVARVRVLDPEEYEQGDDLLPYDLEVTLVHELVHLPMDAFSPIDGEYDLRYVAMEQATNTFAQALVRLKRGN